MFEKIYLNVPNFIQNLLITLFNVKAYKKRYGGKYSHYLELAKQNRTLSIDALKEIQKQRYAEFVNTATEKTTFYKNLYAGIEAPENIENIRNLPIVNKEMVRKHIDELYTIEKHNGIVSKTGGTTGKSLEVLFTNENMQERFAMLDDFRGRFGYELGKKTAWFSGKNLLNDRDVRKNRFWKTDLSNKVRYYSTFHVKENYLKSYIENLMQFEPEYMVGFPSTMLEIAKYGLQHQIDFPADVVKAIFPTAETVTAETREKLEKFFKTAVYDQYASSEGAPFIFECQNHNLHLELQSGVFEVLDQNNAPTNSGRLIITSFSTVGTPLIRYDIGDSVSLSEETCGCGNHNPLVKEILGRIDDYVYSPQNGKINLGNVSNTLKDTKGIVKFMVVQDRLDQLKIHLIRDNSIYNDEIEKKFLQNWRDRVGNDMEIELVYTNEIPVESSGKFRMVKNNIKHLIN